LERLLPAGTVQPFDEAVSLVSWPAGYNLQVFQLVVDFIFITRAVGTLPEIRLSASPPKIRLKAHALTRRKQIELIMALIR
jgi:hypothetical protein